MLVAIRTSTHEDAVETGWLLAIADYPTRPHANTRPSRCGSCLCGCVEPASPAPRTADLGCVEAQAKCLCCDMPCRVGWGSSRCYLELRVGNRRTHAFLRTHIDELGRITPAAKFDRCNEPKRSDLQKLRAGRTQCAANARPASGRAHTGCRSRTVRRTLGRSIDLGGLVLHFSCANGGSGETHGNWGIGLIWAHRTPTNTLVQTAAAHGRPWTSVDTYRAKRPILSCSEHGERRQWTWK
jgi:hypothetical protein